MARESRSAGPALDGGPLSSAFVAVLFGAGLCALFVGERAIGAGAGRGVVGGLGIAVILAALSLRAARVAKAPSAERRGVEVLLLALKAAALLGLGLYALQSDLYTRLAGAGLDKGWPKLAIGLQVAWPAVVLAALAPMVLIELSYASMARAAVVETGRVRDALWSGLGLAGALVFAFSVGYVAHARDKKVDLSYFRTARPGEATRKVVQNLAEPVTVSYFFPKANDVREEIAGYFDDLAKESPLLEVTGYDHAFDPAKARELGVSGNGILVFSRGARREQMSMGVEIEGARSQLRNLDKDVQKRLLQVSRPSRTVYLTTGHGERTADPAGDTDKRFTVRTVRLLLSDLGYTVRDLGAADGLAQEVPSDAGAVMILGPTKPLLPEEAEALARYFDRGGHLYVALDPEAGLDFKELLGPMGLVFSPTTLASDTSYAPRFRQPSDRGNLIAQSYSSHPTMTTLGRARQPVVMLGAGSLDEAKPRPANTTIDFTVHAAASTWRDLDGDYEFAAATESRKPYELVAAVSRKRPQPAGAAPPAKAPAGTTEDGRAIVLADSDVISDPVLPNAGNPYLVVDAMKWLLGDEAIVGETSSEVDLPIAHTRAQDRWWFYSTIVLAPGLALGAGWLATRRRKTGRRAAGAAGAAKEARP